MPGPDVTEATIAASTDTPVAPTPTPGAKLPHGPLTSRVDYPPLVATARFTWVSAHGGAGSTSLAATSGHSEAITRLWPAPDLGWPHCVALVCRNNIAGLTAAGRMLAEVASGAVGDIKILALIVVADAPVKPTRAMRARLHELSGAVPLVLPVPWLAAWRETPASADKSVTHIAATLDAIAQKETP